jgi:hypothetical protein
MAHYRFSQEAWEIYSRFMKASTEWQLPKLAQDAIVHADGFYKSYSFLDNKKHGCRSLVGMRTEKTEEGGITLTRTLLWSEGYDFPRIVQVEYEQRQRSTRNIGRAYGTIVSAVIQANYFIGHGIKIESASADADFAISFLVTVGAAALSLLIGWVMGFVAQIMVTKQKIDHDEPYTLAVSNV